MNKKLQIDRLNSGGVITNYYCTSRCDHCLYACSPTWPKDYIEIDVLFRVKDKLKELNCYSVHIGGGEPFLNRKGLEQAMRIFSRYGINIEYVETNSSWYKGMRDSIELLNRLKTVGLERLLVSMSPFHNKNIPFNKVKSVIFASKKAGIDIFPWINDFYNEINSFVDKKTHKPAEYIKKFGKSYFKDLLNRYWVQMNGRAVYFYEKLFKKKNINEILESSERCIELENTNHFHMDLFGNYVPGLCSGISIKIEDLGKPISMEKYPFISVLFNKGIQGLLDIAIKNYGFKPEERYLNKCHLCMEIRKYLVLSKKIKTIEFQPLEFYKNL